MTISNMTIFLKTLKYDYMQYEYFFEKIVIFYEKNMTKKKTYGYDSPKLIVDSGGTESTTPLS